MTDYQGKSSYDIIEQWCWAHQAVLHYQPGAGWVLSDRQGRRLPPEDWPLWFVALLPWPESCWEWRRRYHEPRHAAPGTAFVPTPLQRAWIDYISSTAASDPIPDDTQCSAEEWDAKIDTILADAKRWLAQPEPEGHE